MDEIVRYKGDKEIIVNFIREYVKSTKNCYK